MRKQNELLGSRTQVGRRFALLPIEGVPYSRIPSWPSAQIQVLASPALGAGFVQYRMELDGGASGSQASDGRSESFLYVLAGTVRLSFGSDARVGFAPTRTGNDKSQRDPAAHVAELGPGGYALIPPGISWSLKAASPAQLTVVRKEYEHVEGIALYEPLVGNQAEVQGEIYMGDKGALLQSLIPDDFAYDMAMNIFTFESGHSLPVTETHVMEHGLIVLQGKGLYYLEDRWMEVEESDFIWMGPFCPQSYYATGPVATRYLYYKNVNRDIPVS